MIEDTFIVQDIRRVRCAISERFANDVDQYIDYLQRKSTSLGQTPHGEAFDSRESVRTVSDTVESTEVGVT
ncbi:MAG: hypothetical protein O7E52_06450 [Candidatus Poribacteria bacterium]|nr:hypothetical protein [Candidatus Poribacteria bacterium]